jgi:hypothetical protein
MSPYYDIPSYATELAFEAQLLNDEPPEIVEPAAHASESTPDGTTTPEGTPSPQQVDNPDFPF